MRSLKILLKVREKYNCRREILQPWLCSCTILWFMVRLGGTCAILWCPCCLVGSVGIVRKVAPACP